MKQLILVLSLVLSINAYAQDNKTVTLVVSGQGETQDEAKQNALRSAIEQAFGTFISSKTEILNDQVVADQMASVTSGNIKSFAVLNESHLPRGNWAVTVKAIISVDKLTSFVQANGIAIEIKGGLFAHNIKQQLLNEQGEIKAVAEMVGLLHEAMQISFDYVIESGDPKSLDSESRNWEIPLTVLATTNKNIEICATYALKTLAAISLTSEEIASYESLNKVVYPVTINYNGVQSDFYLRKHTSLNALKTLVEQWEFYTRSFTVHTGMDEIHGADTRLMRLRNSSRIHDFNGWPTNRNSRLDFTTGGMINFLNSGQTAAVFVWQDKRTLSQIEQMTGYEVKPRGVSSPFRHGGLVVYEDNGHGLVLAIADLGAVMSWENAVASCDQLVLNGYSDWHLPSKEELVLVHEKLRNIRVGGLTKPSYWSSTENGSMAWYLDEAPLFSWQNKGYEHSVRAVRAF